MYYSAIKNCDVSNGEGIRISLFVSGCSHHCYGCFNSDTWDYDFGEIYTDSQTKEIIKLLEPSYIHGFTLLGGEPLDPLNQHEVSNIINQIKKVYPDLNIWCYTGYTLEYLLEHLNSDLENILSNIDVLVDGRFEMELKNLSLAFKGSSNQRLINLKETFKRNELILYQLA